MGIDVELWRARIGTFNGRKGSRKLRALLAFRRLFLRDPVALATGETTNCTPVAVQASIACLSLWLILRFLGSCWNKIKSTHPTKFNGGLSYHWSKDPKAPVSITLSIGVVVAIAVLLHSLTILLLRAGDVELNPGPITLSESLLYCVPEMQMITIRLINYIILAMGMVIVYVSRVYPFHEL